MNNKRRLNHFLNSFFLDKFFKLTLFILFLGTFFCKLSLNPNPVFAQQVSTNEIIVKFKPSIDHSIREKIIGNIGGTIKTKIDQVRMSVLKVPDGMADKMIELYKKNPLVEYAEVNSIATKFIATNDPLLSNQWGLFSIDAAEIGNVSAWDSSTGSSSVKIAIVDTGIDESHSDLQNKIVSSINFTNSPSTSDFDGHGTHVAGIAGASTNNGIGVAGVSYNTSLMNVKVLGDDGSGNYSWIVSGIIWAVDNGANVINLSLGGTSPSTALQDAINYAWQKGVIVVAAAGNNSWSFPMYPAYYSNAIAVGAIDSNNRKASWSNYGSWVDVVAPGVSIYSAYKGNSYAFYSGTSMAAPFVSGLAGLVWAKGDCATNTCVRSKIENNTDQISGTGAYWKYGKINAYKSVLSSNLVSSTPTPTPTPTSTPTSTPTPSPTPTPTNTPNSDSKSITISYLRMISTGSTSIKNITAKAKVIDTTMNNAVISASVLLSITSPSGKVTNFTRSTAWNGEAQATVFSSEKGTFTTNIINVTKSGFTYLPTITSTALLVQ